MNTSRSRRLFRYLLTLFICSPAAYPLTAQALDTPENPPLVEKLRDQPDLDQILARVPVPEAPIASVAQARVEIALHKARQKAGTRSCAGRWVPSGPVSSSHYGTATTKARLVSRDKDYWYYQVSREPLPLTCANASRADYFLEMSRHLPEWVIIRPAGQQFAFQGGRTVAAGRTTVLALAR
jgi:hypothetical protein